MPPEKTPDDHSSDFPSPKGMQGWLEREIGDIQKAAELRIREATRFVNEYARGEITQREAEQRSTAYADRWGEVIPGVTRTQGLSDEEIITRLDAARANEGFVDRNVLGRKRGTPETSR